jgi:hypothetical protein
MLKHFADGAWIKPAHEESEFKKVGISQPHPEVPLVIIGYTYDNSDGRGELIAERESKTRLIVHDPIR